MDKCRFHMDGGYFTEVELHFMNLQTNYIFVAFAGLFDKEHTGTINLEQFQALFSYVNAWIGLFKGYDRDNSGSIQAEELSSALRQMGYSLSQDFIKLLIDKSDPQNHDSITIDQFIVVCTQIQKCTGEKLEF